MFLVSYRASYVLQKLEKYETVAQEKSTRRIQYMVIDLSPVGNIDTTALRSLQEVVGDYKGRGVTLCLCNPNTLVMARLVKSGFADLIGYENIFVSEHQAVNICLGRLAQVEAEPSEGSEQDLKSDVEIGAIPSTVEPDYVESLSTDGEVDK